MNTLKNTKFWIALATLGLQLGMFAVLFIFRPELLTETVIFGLLGAAVATLTSFGAMNIVASGQATKEEIARLEAKVEPKV
jgi:hypothetical protein